MGVPVVTCPGETFASRHSLSLMSNIGMTETIATDMDDYVRIAIELAGDLPRLKELRRRLRGQMARSTLCEAPSFTRAFEALCRTMWRNYCERPATTSAMEPAIANHS